MRGDPRHDDPWSEEDEPPGRRRGGGMPRADLHGLRPEQALKRVAQLLHQARVQGAPEVEIITGRGLGNAQMSPVLRTRVEAWLLGPEGRRHGALSFQRQAKGGSLRVKVQRRG